jgi:FixJ family two-component response regulator
LASDNPKTFVNETDIPLPTTSSEVEEYAPLIQNLSRRELEVIEAILAGNVSHK